LKKITNIFLLGVLFVLPALIQANSSAVVDLGLEKAQIVHHHGQSNVPQDGIYDPFLPFKGETSFLLSIKVPKPELNENLDDQKSKEVLAKASFPNNNTSFITTSSQIDVGLTVKKLIFPFHSFL
jgi:hypothetical protein